MLCSGCLRCMVFLLGCASQVWGTVYLSEGSEFGSQLQNEEASVFLEAHSRGEEQHNKLGGA